MIAHSFDEAFTLVRALVTDFHANKAHFFSPEYSEFNVRQQFINKFWQALGWDLLHDEEKNPLMWDVEVEKNVNVEGRGKRADYAFLSPGRRDVLFFVEAKKPARNIDNPQDYFQTIRYGWHRQTPIAILTNFEELRVLDCRYKPDVDTVLRRGALEKYRYSDYAEPEKFAELYHLFSRTEAQGGALAQYVERLPKPKRSAQQRGLFAKGAYQSIDESFLLDLDRYRETLAGAFKRTQPQLDGGQLTELTQRTLDRLVFMRFLEDKLIETDELVEPLALSEQPWADFIALSRSLNRVYNGIIFRQHPLLDAPNFRVDERDFQDICLSLSHERSPYDFNLLPVHILGSIYERFLGKTIVVEGRSAVVVEKPEVRKAGGVYYTPEYVVRYIVDQTVGRFIEGKKPEQIRTLRFADIACGSGSFLLGIYDLLLRYHKEYYNRNQRTRAEGVRAGCLVEPDNSLRLSLLQKRTILLNNVYGVDVDDQAVEVAQLSLYLKLLEEETTATAHSQQLALREALLPSLSDNIKSGNSLIDLDILDGQLFEIDRDESLKLNPMNLTREFPRIMRDGGFDAIIGNPPYIRIQTLKDSTPHAVDYLRRRYPSARKGNYDIYVVFVEKALNLLNERGVLGYILPHKFFNAQYGEPLRELVSAGKHLAHVVHFGAHQVFPGATTYTCLLFLTKASKDEINFVKVMDLDAWRETGEGVRGIIPATQLTADEWNFAVGEGVALFRKLNQMPMKLGDVADVFVGLQTSADDVFIMNFVAESEETIRLYSKSLNSEWAFEKVIVFPLVSGTDIERYADLPERQYILFPYEVEDEVAELIDFGVLSDKYPETTAYLLMNKDRLQGRERGKFIDAQWYRFGRNQNLGIQQRVKLCVPRLVESLHAAFDFDGTHFLDNVDVGGVTLKHAYRDQNLLYLLALLNSRLLRWYFPFVSAPFRGGYLSANRQFLAQLPFRTINFAKSAEKRQHQEVLRLVEQIVAARQQLMMAKTERERNMHERKYAAADRQLDALIYDLYGLTADEVALVELGS